MNTGGTRDIIEPEVTGLLSTTPDGLARTSRRLVADPTRAPRLGDAARAAPRFERGSSSARGGRGSRRSSRRRRADGCPMKSVRVALARALGLSAARRRRPRAPRLRPGPRIWRARRRVTLITRRRRRGRWARGRVASGASRRASRPVSDVPVGGTARDDGDRSRTAYPLFGWRAGGDVELVRAGADRHRPRLRRQRPRLRAARARTAAPRRSCSTRRGSRSSAPRIRAGPG